MMKTWLMRRPVRSPVSRATTAPSSSSVCRLPFISSSALPLRTSSTAFAAAAWLCGASTIRVLPEVDAGRCGDLRDLRGRADEDRRDQSQLRRLRSRRPAPVSRTDARPRSGSARRLVAALQQLFVLSGSGVCGHACVLPASAGAVGASRRPGLLEEKREQDGQRDAVEQRVEGRLVVLERQSARRRR